MQKVGMGTIYGEWIGKGRNRLAGDALGGNHSAVIPTRDGVGLNQN